MNRKTLICMLAVCLILLAAEMAVLLTVFSKDRKKGRSGESNSKKPEVTQEVPTDTPEPTQEAERKLKEWEELEAGDPKIQYNPEFQNVWRITGQKFYTSNDMFFWLEQFNFMEEPILWSKDIDPSNVASTQTGQRLNDVLVYDYDQNGNLVYYSQLLNMTYEGDFQPEYVISYDALFSPLVGVFYDAPTNLPPTCSYEYRYNRDGDVVHKWITLSDPTWAEYYEWSWYPEYKYYYWEDGKLAKWEGYSADGQLKEEVQVTYVTDTAGRVTEYREDSDLRRIQKEYAYNSDGNLTEMRESVRQYFGWGYGYDATKQYNEAGELIAKHQKFYDVNVEAKTETPTDWEEYDFHASEDEKGQRIADFMMYGLDGYASYFGKYHREYVYDTAGNVIERLTYINGLLVYREEITYEQVRVPLRNLTEEERIKLRIFDDVAH